MDNLTEALFIRVTPEMKSQIKQLAKDDGREISNMSRHLLKKGIETITKKTETNEDSKH